MAARIDAFADPTDIETPQPVTVNTVLTSTSSESAADVIIREIAEIDEQVAQVNLDSALSAVSLEQANRTYQGLLTTIANQKDVIAVLRTDIINMVNAENQSPGLGIAVAFITSKSPEGFLNELATRESITRLLAERVARFNSERDRLAGMETDLGEQVKAIEAEEKRQKELLDAQLRAAAAARAALAKLTPEEREAMRASIAASGGVLPFTRPSGGNVTSPYGPRDPLFGRSFHYGTDFGISCGSPVIAGASGIVIQAGSYASFGNYVKIDHGNSGMGNYYITGYAHMSAILVRAGQFVNRGELIGLVGNTGESTGCHLHFEVYENGQNVDGYRYLPEGMATGQ
jgi:murein DD-endopeptidase MepM/ murein hydrolase activator NlpD